MKEQDWVALQAEAPFAVNACLHYFQYRYGNWRSKIMEVDAIFTYLGSRGFEITVSTFGIPNRKDWYCEVYFQESLLLHERDFKTFQLAAFEAITIAFIALERALVN